VIGMLDALGEEHAVVFGHDWGATLAWSTALFRPDRVRGVGTLSVPYRPRGPMSLLTAVRQRAGERFYMAYFQTPGVADAELGRDPRMTLRRLLYAGSGALEPSPSTVLVPEGGWAAAMPEPPELPSWLTTEDLDAYTAEFERTGFTGGLNWYRAIDLSWELMAPWHGAQITQPALYLAGDRDLVVSLAGGAEAAIDNLRRSVPDLRVAKILPGCGHWTQQERPAEVNTALLELLRSLT